MPKLFECPTPERVGIAFRKGSPQFKAAVDRTLADAGADGSLKAISLAIKEVIATTFKPLPLYIAAALIYWCMSLGFEALQRVAERGLNRAHQ